VREQPRPGDSVTHEVTVTADMTARLFGREYHPVLGTAWLVLHAEEAGRLLVEPHLGPDEDAAGYRIELTHERPANIGDRLSITATVVEVDERSCTVDFEARGPAGVVGRGRFVQRYVPRGRLGGRPDQGDPA